METNELPIATQINEDRLGESIETFYVDLPGPTRYSPPIARSVDPSRVAVSIVDDDCEWKEIINVIILSHTVLFHSPKLIGTSAKIKPFPLDD